MPVAPTAFATADPALFKTAPASNSLLKALATTPFGLNNPTIWSTPRSEAAELAKDPKERPEPPAKEAIKLFI